MLSSSPPLWIRMLKLGLLAALPLAAVVTPPQGHAIFRSGTRLVEVEVVVRGERVRPPGFRDWLRWTFDSGPPFGPPGPHVQGLTKDDFAVFDNGQPQPIAVFHAGPAAVEASLPLPPGTVSNREDVRGQSLNAVTVVLIDLLNTPFDLTEHARLGMKEFLGSLRDADNTVALYSLGEKLHILHDFNDDPQKLIDVASELDKPHGALPLEIATALRDYGDLVGLDGGQGAAADVHGQITFKSIRTIVQHLSGLPGRKSLVWLSSLTRVPPGVIAMLQQANIVLYPVAVRGAGLVGLESDFATQAGTASGGRGFNDARDLAFSVQTAEEDSHGAYVLGYYPAEDVLDGKFHKITVKLRNKALNDSALEIHYRSGYLATKVAVSAPPPSLAEIFSDPLNATGIALSGRATPLAQHPGLYNVQVTADLHDLRLEPKDGRLAGGFDFAIPNPSSKGTIKTGAVTVDLKEDQLAQALESGYTLNIQGVQPESGEIRVVIRDRSTGAAGSVRIPVADLPRNNRSE